MSKGFCLCLPSLACFGGFSSPPRWPAARQPAAPTPDPAPPFWTPTCSDAPTAISNESIPSPLCSPVSMPAFPPSVPHSRPPTSAWMPMSKRAGSANSPAAAWSKLSDTPKHPLSSPPMARLPACCPPQPPEPPCPQAPRSATQKISLPSSNAPAPPATTPRPESWDSRRPPTRP